MASPIASVPPPHPLVGIDHGSPMSPTPSDVAATTTTTTTTVVDPVMAAAVVVVAPVIAAAAVVASASSLSADTLVPLVQLAIALNNNNNNNSSNDQAEAQPLLQLIPEYRVRLQDDNLAASLVQLDTLIVACEQATIDRQAGWAPGFTSRTTGPKLDAFVGRNWSLAPNQPYEMLDMHHHHNRHNEQTPRFIPVPSIHSAAHAYKVVRTVLHERWTFVQATKDDQKEKMDTFCSCFSKWDHVDGSIAMQLVNQCMEQVSKV